MSFSSSQGGAFALARSRKGRQGVLEHGGDGARELVGVDLGTAQNARRFQNRLHRQGRGLGRAAADFVLQREQALEGADVQACLKVLRVLDVGAALELAALDGRADRFAKERLETAHFVGQTQREVEKTGIDAS